MPRLGHALAVSCTLCTLCSESDCRVGAGRGLVALSPLGGGDSVPSTLSDWRARDRREDLVLGGLGEGEALPY
eukprot:7042601-Prymnesium_polylepis.1